MGRGFPAPLLVLVGSSLLLGIPYRRLGRTPMTVISNYRDVPVLRDATFPDDLDAIVNDPTNHHILEVVVGLTDVSDIVAFTRPKEGLTVAKAAIKLAGRLPKHTPDWFRGHARSFSVAASRLRGIGDLPGAETMFSLAYDCLEKIPGEDFAERADRYRRVGFLRIDQGAFRDALDMGNQSRRHFEFARNTHGIGCALVCRGIAFAHLENLDDAIGDFRTALDLLDPGLGFNHVWAASINLATALIDSENEKHDMDQAIRQLEAVNELRQYEEGTIPFLSVLWAQARLLMKQADYVSAQEKLRGVCAGWRDLDLEIELTKASLDLARCYFEQGLLAHLIQLAGEMFPLFARFRHDERAYRKLKEFHRAALDGGLQAGLIAEARTAVEVVVRVA